LKISLFVLIEFTNVTDGHTQTPHDGIGRACIKWQKRQKLSKVISIKVIRKKLC